MRLNEENFWYFDILEIPIIVEMNVLPEVNELPVQSDQSQLVWDFQIFVGLCSVIG